MYTHTQNTKTHTNTQTHTKPHADTNICTKPHRNLHKSINVHTERESLTKRRKKKKLHTFSIIKKNTHKYAHAQNSITHWNIHLLTQRIKYTQNGLKNCIHIAENKTTVIITPNLTHKKKLKNKYTHRNTHTHKKSQKYTHIHTHREWERHSHTHMHIHIHK